MKVEKQELVEMERCYCVSTLRLEGQSWAVFASEAIGGPCYAYQAPDFKNRRVIWPKAGGTMSFVQLPGRKAEFLAVQNFFPGFKSEGAKLVWGRLVNGEWRIQDVLKLPFIHRFDVLQSGGVNYLFAATLCSSKKFREDWSDPGHYYVGIVPDDLSRGLSVEALPGSYFHNHGFCKGTWKGRQAAFATSDEGVFVVLPPERSGGKWTVEKIMSGTIGDVAFADVDGDGELEMATLEPFHGNSFHIYKHRGEQWERIYTYQRPMEFAHAVWGGELFGQGSFLGGVRRLNCELFLVQYDKAKGQFVTQILDEGVGVSNVTVLHQPEEEIIVSANHTKNQAALYRLKA